MLSWHLSFWGRFLHRSHRRHEKVRKILAKKFVGTFGHWILSYRIVAEGNVPHSWLPDWESNITHSVKGCLWLAGWGWGVGLTQASVIMARILFFTTWILKYLCTLNWRKSVKINLFLMIHYTPWYEDVWVNGVYLHVFLILALRGLSAASVYSRFTS